MFLKNLWKNFQTKSNKLLCVLACFCLAFYKSFISGSLACGAACRFYPSCSDYAYLLYKKYSFFKASILTIQRLLDCRPFGPKWRNEIQFIEDKK